MSWTAKNMTKSLIKYSNLGAKSQYGAVNDRVAKMAVYELNKSIDQLLWQIDNYAKTDALGWIK
jgi:hypothetical protein